MNPTIDIKGEHAAITIVLKAMKKLAFDMRIGKFIDSYRIVQILDFLHTFTENCHSQKEEKSLYPAMLAYDIPWTAATIKHLISENRLAHEYISEIDRYFDEYLSGNTQVLNALSSAMIKYVELEENHIRIVDKVIIPLCDRIFDYKTLARISAEFKAIQDQNVGQLKHLEYFKMLSLLYTEDRIFTKSVNY